MNVEAECRRDDVQNWRTHETMVARERNGVVGGDDQGGEVRGTGEDARAVACERQDKKPNSGTTVVVQHPTLLESLSFEERCRAAFASHAKDGVLPATSFDAAFRQAGYPDARQEEVDRYHVNFVQERKGIPGTHLREEEFVRILLGHDQKRRFLQTFRISSDDRVCNLVRSISHCFTRCTLQHGQHLWSHSSAESRMGIIMEGRAMLWA